MEEKERQDGRNREGESGGYQGNSNIEIDVTVHNVHKGKISIAAGSTLSELLDAVAKQFSVNVSEFKVVLDGKIRDLSKENPILTSSSTLALIKKIVGG